MLASFLSLLGDFSGGTREQKNGRKLRIKNNRLGTYPRPKLVPTDLPIHLELAMGLVMVRDNDGHISLKLATHRLDLWASSSMFLILILCTWKMKVMILSSLEDWGNEHKVPSYAPEFKTL